MKLKKLNLVLLTVVLIASATIICGMKNNPPSENCKRVVIHTVRQGDTLRAISYKYLELNTYENKYILAFEQDIKKLNPELTAPNRYLQPGDKLVVEYLVKE